LGSLSQVIDGDLENLLKHGIRRTDLARLRQEIEAADIDVEKRQALDEDLESARQRQNELRESIDQLRTMADRSRREAGLDEDHFRAAISCALELLHAPPLKPAGDGRYIIPKLDDAQASWAETMDSLRAPRPREQKFYEWRRTSPIRPVVFEDPGTVTDAVVQLHLEQRAVQRLLGRFLSQGFVHDDLSRACLAQTKDSIPRVLLLGRRALYGPGAARLHEEIIPVTARWIDPAIRKSPLTPYARDAESRTLNLLDASLLAAATAIEPTIVGNLQHSTVRDIAELLPHLEQRGQEYAEDAIRKLAQRGEDESKQMREILESQRKHIAATAEKSSQSTLPFRDDELRQLEANRRHWGRRLSEIETELETEPARVRDVYQVRARRIEPVGLIYLWPVTN
jgi:hypothetical protein